MTDSAISTQHSALGTLHFDAVVVGAGPAGSAVALQLARRDRSVLLLEAERYPVHKMCGEFLSVEAWQLFRALGVDEEIRSRGAVPIRRVAVTSLAGGRWEGRLPGEAIGFSRWALDPLLFDAAVEAGAVGLQGARVRAVERSGERFRVAFSRDGEDYEAEAQLVVGAFGKHSRLDKELGREPNDASAGFVAFKMHYTGDDLDDWVELHAFEGGYCGLQQVEGGRVNACLIAWTGALRDSGGSFEAMRETLLRTNPSLSRRLDRLEPAMERPVSIARMTFRTKELFSRGVMMVGDTAAMIAPLCGDGMSMALRSAEIAAPLADRYLSGELSFAELERDYTHAWRGAFSRRLRIGRALQSGLFRPRVASFGLSALNAAPALGRFFIRATRDTGSASQGGTG